MTKDERIERYRDLLLKLEDCEQECHALGIHDTAHLVNGVKNGVGWGFAKMMESRASVSRSRKS